MILIRLSIVDKSQSSNHHVDHYHKREDDDKDVFVPKVFIANRPAVCDHEEHPDEQYLSNDLRDNCKHVEHEHSFSIIAVHEVVDRKTEQMKQLYCDRAHENQVWMDPVESFPSFSEVVNSTCTKKNGEGDEHDDAGCEESIVFLGEVLKVVHEFDFYFNLGKSREFIPDVLRAVDCHYIPKLCLTFSSKHPTHLLTPLALTWNLKVVPYIREVFYLLT